MPSSFNWLSNLQHSTKSANENVTNRMLLPEKHFSTFKGMEHAIDNLHKSDSNYLLDA